ncbi:hypothetical protein PINS_up013855 [Pythium insidiosum]|nr:hypothetical protein PINS_up013855 [Pythium insidiosum]
MARVAYLSLFFVNAIGAALLREYGQYALAFLVSVLRISQECDEYEDSGHCFGNQIVYRISFALACFFSLTAVLSCAVARGCENCCCLLLFQIPFYVVMLFATLFIPNSFFDGYAQVARVASGAFIVLQIIIIVDWAYNLRDYFLEKIDTAAQDDEARQSLLESDSSYTSPKSSTTMWEGAFLALVCVLFAGAIAGIVLMLKFYAGCDLNMAFIIITIFSLVLLTVMSVLAWIGVGLLPAAAVSCYLVLMCYQAVHSNPDESCTAHINVDTPSHATHNVLLNSLLAALTITWTSWRTSGTSTHLLSLSPSKAQLHSDEKDDLAVTDDDNLDDVTANRQAPQVPEHQFHVLMVLSSLYMAMVITNWGSSNGIDNVNDQAATMWVKAASQWAAAAVFLWTLVAPTVLPDRDFGL